MEIISNFTKMVKYNDMHLGEIFYIDNDGYYMIIKVSKGHTSVFNLLHLESMISYDPDCIIEYDKEYPMYKGKLFLENLTNNK